MRFFDKYFCYSKYIQWLQYQQIITVEIACSFKCKSLEQLDYDQTKTLKPTRVEELHTATEMQPTKIEIPYKTSKYEGTEKIGKNWSY